MTEATELHETRRRWQPVRGSRVELAVRKPRALRSRSMLVPFAPASPAELQRMRRASRNCAGSDFTWPMRQLKPEGYFAGTDCGATELRFSSGLRTAIDVDGLVALRGGTVQIIFWTILRCRRLQTPKSLIGLQRPHVFADLSVADVSLDQVLWADGRGGI